MATKIITEEMIAAACNELVKNGDEPGTLKVHKLIGGKGSTTTVQKYIKTWRESEIGQEAIEAAKKAEMESVEKNITKAKSQEMPEHFFNESERFLAKIYKIAEADYLDKISIIQDEFAKKVEVTEAECAAKIDVAENETKGWMKEVDDKNEITEELEEELKAVRVQLSEKIATIGGNDVLISSLISEDAKQKVKLKAMEAALESNADIIKKYETKIELLTQERDIAKADRAEAKEQFTIEKSALIDSHKADLNNIQNDHKQSLDVISKANTEAITEINKAKDQTIDTLKDSSKDAKKQRDDAIFQLEKLSEEMKKLKLKLNLQIENASKNSKKS